MKVASRENGSGEEEWRAEKTMHWKAVGESIKLIQDLLVLLI